jgi:hypothetical protein
MFKLRGMTGMRRAACTREINACILTGRLERRKTTSKC